MDPYFVSPIEVCLPIIETIQKPKFKISGFQMTSVHVVVVRKFSAALVVLRRAALVESKQTDDAGLVICKANFASKRLNLANAMLTNYQKIFWKLCVKWRVGCLVG